LFRIDDAQSRFDAQRPKILYEWGAARRNFAREWIKDYVRKCFPVF